MTEQTINSEPIPFPEHMRPPAPAPKKPLWKKPVVFLPVIALLAGVGIGSGNVRTETVTVEKPVEKRVEVKVPTTPAACITALNLGDQALTYAAEAMGYSNDALKAAGKLDASGIYAAKDKMDILTPKISALGDPLKSAKAECRAQ